MLLCLKKITEKNSVPPVCSVREYYVSLSPSSIIILCVPCVLCERYSFCPLRSALCAMLYAFSFLPREIDEVTVYQVKFLPRLPRR